MKAQTKMFLLLLMLLLAVSFAYAGSPLKYGIDPHDSLLFDGSGGMLLNSDLGIKGCQIKVLKVRGKVTGKVLKKELAYDCAEIPDTIITSVDKDLEFGDKLVEGSYVETGPDALVTLGIYITGDGVGYNSVGDPLFSSFRLEVTANSLIVVPSISEFCSRMKEKEEKPVQEIPVIKGIITYEDEPGTKPKFKTKGKRSSVNHTKTRFSHEVKFEGSDTIDVIRVYEGAVEVTMVSIDTDDANMTKKMENIGEEMRSGNLSAEEIQAKMIEFQNYTQKINELMQPLGVSEGFKCIVSKNSRVVEPLGTGDEEMK